MLERIVQWAQSIFAKAIGFVTGRQLSRAEAHRRDYENTEEINFNAIFANSLTNKAVADCRMNVTNAADRDSKRSLLIRDTLMPVWDGIKPTLMQALGKGGKFLVPTVVGHSVSVTAVDQSRVAISAVDGNGEIASLTLVAETRENGNTVYARLMDYTRENGAVTIRTKAVDVNGGKEVPLSILPDWGSITPELTISNADRLPIAYLKCPQDSRKPGYYYGVPITYGSEDIERQLRQCLKDIETEFVNKKSLILMDETMFGKGHKLPDSGLFKRLKGGGQLAKGGATFYEVFDPAIRDSSMYNRYIQLCGMFEKSVGTSRGVLTEPSTSAATATEIKAANHDTYSMVSEIRKNLEKVFEDLAYSADLLAESFGLTPAGARNDYKVTFDWDTSLIESSTEMFNQLSELESRGLIQSARLVSFVTGQGMSEAQAEIDAVSETAPRTLLRKEDEADNPIVRASHADA